MTSNRNLSYPLLQNCHIIFAYLFSAALYTRFQKQCCSVNLNLELLSFQLKAVMLNLMQSSWSKCISKTNSKLQIPCSKCMQQPCDHPMTSHANACCKCMQQQCYCPVMSQDDACSYCMSSVVQILSRIYQGILKGEVSLYHSPPV